jgi:hypothetical protein
VSTTFTQRVHARYRPGIVCYTLSRSRSAPPLIRHHLPYQAIVARFKVCWCDADAHLRSSR